MLTTVTHQTMATEHSVLLSGSGSFLRRSLATTGTRLLDLPSRYGLHLLIAARLPVAEVGAFYVVFSTITLLSGLGRLGVDRALTRELAVAMGLNLPQTVRTTVAKAFAITAAQSGGIVLLLIALAGPISRYVLHKPALAVPLIVGALTIIPQNLSTSAAGALAGLGRVATSQMIYQWLWPMLFCIVAVVMPLTVTRALILIGACLIAAAVIGLLLMWRAMPEKPAQTVPSNAAPLSRLGVSLFSLEILQLAISSAPTFVLGVVASTADVGRYALAWRIVLMLNLLVNAMGAIASPQFARAAALNDHTSLGRIAAQSVGLTVALSGVPALVLALNPRFFLDRFGAGYAPAAPSLRILLIGQTAMILCAAVPELLGMTGHGKALIRINIASVALLAPGLAILTPRYGSAGAALATALTMFANAVMVTVAAKRALGIVPLVDFFEEVRKWPSKGLRAG